MAFVAVQLRVGVVLNPVIRSGGPGASGGAGAGPAGVGGVVVEPVTTTLSNAEVLRTDVSWLPTINPTLADVMATVVLPMTIQSDPFADTEPVAVLPVRASFSHVGGACDPLAMNVVAPPLDERAMNSMLPSGRTSSNTWGDPAAVVSRSMTPAFANVFVFCTAVTRDTI